MKKLKTFLVSAVVSFVVFYTIAALIEATFNIHQMMQSTREIVFGIWGAILCFIAFGIATADITLNREK